MQGVPYPTSEAVPAVPAPAAAVTEGKGKGKGGGTSPEKGSSGAPSGEDASRRYRFSLLPCQRGFNFLFAPFLFLPKFSSNYVGTASHYCLVSAAVLNFFSPLSLFWLNSVRILLRV